MVKAVWLIALVLTAHGCAGEDLVLDPDTRRLRQRAQLATTLGQHLANLQPVLHASVVLDRHSARPLAGDPGASVIAVIDPGFDPARSQPLRREIAEIVAAAVTALDPDDVTVVLTPSRDPLAAASFTGLPGRIGRTFETTRPSPQPASEPASPDQATTAPSLETTLVSVGPVRVARESRWLARLLVAGLLLVIALLALWLVRAERRIAALQRARPR